ncbi:MAG: hypothetical protein PSN34_03375, partial [Urechidicola sp.]|nr:hypothetical protein [Urechidicola sp.]
FNIHQQELTSFFKVNRLTQGPVLCDKLDLDYDPGVVTFSCQAKDAKYIARVSEVNSNKQEKRERLICSYFTEQELQSPGIVHVDVVKNTRTKLILTSGEFPIHNLNSMVDFSQLKLNLYKLDLPSSFKREYKSLFDPWYWFLSVIDIDKLIYPQSGIKVENVVYAFYEKFDILKLKISRLPLVIQNSDLTSKNIVGINKESYQLNSNFAIISWRSWELSPFGFRYNFEVYDEDEVLNTICKIAEGNSDYEKYTIDDFRLSYNLGLLKKFYFNEKYDKCTDVLENLLVFCDERESV